MGVVLKATFLVFFSKLKTDISKKFVPTDCPLMANKIMSYSSRHQFDVESKKIMIKMEIVKNYQNLKFLTYHKICNFQPILTFLMSNPTNLATADSILP